MTLDKAIEILETRHEPSDKELFQVQLFQVHLKLTKWIREGHIPLRELKYG